MAKRFRYTSRLRPEASGGVAALLMAAISALLFLAAVIVSYLHEGEAGIVLGAIGLTGLLLAVVGFFIGIRSFSESGKSHRFSTLASIANGILAVVWLGLYLVGIG
jgi:hypothetical protein